MSDRPPLLKNPTAPVLEALTASWSAPEHTATFDFQSTPGPNDALLQTIAKVRAEFSPSQFPQLPGFHVVGYIDCGGMGHVYRAEQATPKRTVAVKIATSFNRAGMVTRERFDREIQALAAVSHPNIMPIYTAGDWHGFPFYAMRYMPGGPLSKSISRLAGQTTAIAKIMRKVARGLEALHGAGIIHRDLKPHNILLDENDEPLIADFGLAKWLDGSDSELTVTSSALGTKYYMPPEQTTGSKEDYGPASDIWAFGVILFEMLTGTRPFRDDLPGPIFEQIRSAELTIPDRVPEGLATVIRHCLQKGPEDRYVSAVALGEDLDRWLEGAPVDPLPAVPLAPTPKHRIGRMVALGLALAFVAGIAATTAAVWPAKKKSIAERLRNGETVTVIGAKGMPENLGQAVPGAEGQFFLADNGYCSLMAPGLAVRLLSMDQIDLPIEVSVEYAFPDGLFTQTRINENIFPYVGLVFGYRTTFLESQPQHHYFQLVQSYEILDTGATAESASIHRMHWSPTTNGNFINMASAKRPVPISTVKPGSLDWKRMTIDIQPTLLTGNANEMAMKPLRIGGALWNIGLEPNTEPKVGSAIGLSAFLSQAYFRNLKLTPRPQ